jgi:uncharacterized SAM-binding protein YcdF (DUF218 family)
VCLGGGHSEDGLDLNERSRERVARAVALFREQGARTLICSGAYAVAREAPPPETEAVLMARAAVKAGVPASRIMLEEHSLDTIGNIAVVGFRLLPTLEPEAVWMVTSDYHIRRVRYLVERMWAGRFEVEYTPARAGLSPAARIGAVFGEWRLRRKTRKMLSPIEPGDGESFLAARPLLTTHPQSPTKTGFVAESKLR